MLFNQRRYVLSEAYSAVEAADSIFVFGSAKDLSSSNLLFEKC
jgi:hypothetical protein